MSTPTQAQLAETAADNETNHIADPSEFFSDVDGVTIDWDATDEVDDINTFVFADGSKITGAYSGGWYEDDE